MSDPIPVVAVDGPSGSGKGTIARRVADALSWHLLDSGALYRLVGLAASRAGVDLGAEAELAELARGMNVEFGSDAEGGERVLLDGDDVTRALRTEETGRLASAVAPLPAVRNALLAVQRSFRRAPGLVADGRDMGTHVFPDAAVKVFLTATPEERARRRHKQLKDKGIDVSLSALSQDIAARDKRDSERQVAPLKAAEDARLLDSSELTVDQVADLVLSWVRQSSSRQ